MMRRIARSALMRFSRVAPCRSSRSHRLAHTRGQRPSRGRCLRLMESGGKALLHGCGCPQAPPAGSTPLNRRHRWQVESRAPEEERRALLGGAACVRRAGRRHTGGRAGGSVAPRVHIIPLDAEQNRCFACASTFVALWPSLGHLLRGSALFGFPEAPDAGSRCAAWQLWYVVRGVVCGARRGRRPEQKRNECSQSELVCAPSLSTEGHGEGTRETAGCGWISQRHCCRASGRPAECRAVAEPSAFRSALCGGSVESHRHMQARSRGATPPAGHTTEPTECWRQPAPAPRRRWGPHHRAASAMARKLER